MSNAMAAQSTRGQDTVTPTAEIAGNALTPHHEDRELLSRIATQDHQAFERVYRRYAPRVRLYLRRRVGEVDFVDEILNDAMLTLWQHPLRCPPDVLLGAWLCGIARYKAHKALARHRSSALSPSWYKPTDQEVALEQTVMQQEQARLLAGAINLLPFLERKALRLRIGQNYSYQDIAAITGESASTIRTRVSRARQRLRAHVEAAETVRG